MNTTVKISEEADTFHRLAGCSLHTVVRMAGIGLVIILVSLWALIESFYELGKWIVNGGKFTAKTKQLKEHYE